MRSCRLPAGILLLALLVMPSLCAAEWQKVAQSKEATFYVNKDGMRVAGSIVRAWLVDDLAKPAKGGLLSTTRLTEFDCWEGTFRDLESSDHAGHMAGGRTLKADTESRAWRYAVPDTPDFVIQKFICTPPTR